MTTTIADENPMDTARLAALVMDQGEAIAGLTAQVAAIRTAMQLACDAAGVPGPCALGARVGALADISRRAHVAEGLPVPPALALSGPARPPLTVLPGGAR